MLQSRKAAAPLTSPTIKLAGPQASSLGSPLEAFRNGATRHPGQGQKRQLAEPETPAVLSNRGPPSGAWSGPQDQRKRPRVDQEPGTLPETRHLLPGGWAGIFPDPRGSAAREKNVLRSRPALQTPTSQERGFPGPERGLEGSQRGRKDPSQTPPQGVSSNPRIPSKRPSRSPPEESPEGVLERGREGGPEGGPGRGAGGTPRGVLRGLHGGSRLPETPSPEPNRGDPEGSEEGVRRKGSGGLKVRLRRKTSISSEGVDVPVLLHPHSHALSRQLGPGTDQCLCFYFSVNFRSVYRIAVPL